MQAIALQKHLASLRIPPNGAAEREIQRFVWDFVDDRKAAGWPPGRVIIAVKQAASEAGIRPSALIVKRDVKLTTMDDFLVSMVGWCIQRYYGLE